MASWTTYGIAILIGSVLLSLVACLFSPKPPYPDPAALDLIRSMSDYDQRHFQNLAATQGKIEAIKALRARTSAGLKVSKDAIELLEAVKPALLKFS